MCSNIPANPMYGVYVLQLIRICRICDTFTSFVLRHHLLTSKIIKQGFWYNKLCKALQKDTQHRFQNMVLVHGRIYPLLYVYASIHQYHIFETMLCVDRKKTCSRAKFQDFCVSVFSISFSMLCSALCT